MTRDADLLPDGYPTWVPLVVAVPPVFSAIASVVGAGDAWPAVALAVGIAVVPWLIQVLRPGELSRAVFAAWAITPIAVLNLAGHAFGVGLSGDDHSQFSLMILVWLVGEMSARGSLPQLSATVLASTAVIVGRGFVEPTFGHSWSFWLGGLGIAFITGWMLRRQQETLSELREAQAALAGEAALRERQRIAREVHDVVAHTLTVTLMHVSTARRALDRDPSAAREALDEAETLGRRSLADIRRTVGLLRTEGDAPDIHALPDASDIPALLDSYRAAGVSLSDETSGDLSALPPAASLTLYRLVQESIANAVRHAPGSPVDVRIRLRRSQVEVVVRNRTVAAPRTGGDGLGLVGMRERVTLLGGHFEAGEHDGTWQVSARFPVDHAVPAAGAPA